MAAISVDMQQFRSKFKVYSDNVHVYEKVISTGGKFFTLDAREIINQLCEYNIFFTCGESLL